MPRSGRKQSWYREADILVLPLETSSLAGKMRNDGTPYRRAGSCGDRAFHGVVDGRREEEP